MVDLLIRNGLVIDGSGKSGYLADVGVENGKISIIDRSMALEIVSQRVIDAKGMVICPGFIDLHSHTDSSVMWDPTCESSLVQGITTEVTGMCGSSAAPLLPPTAELYKMRTKEYGSEDVEVTWQTVSEYLNKLEKLIPGTNQCLMVGHGTIRNNIIGDEPRFPTDEELTAMKYVVRESLEQGAFGITTGRSYVPGCYGSIKELSEICCVVAEYDGLHSSHIFDQSPNVDWATREVADIARRSGVRSQIAHQKVVGKDNWGRADEVLRMLEEYRGKGIDLMADMYPYTFSQVMLLKDQLPPWMRRLDDCELSRILNTPQSSSKIEEYFTENPNRTWSILYEYGIVDCANTKEYEWMDIGEVASSMSVDVARAVTRLLVDNEMKVKIAGIMSEDDVRKILAHPMVMFGTDAVSGSIMKDQSSLNDYSSLHPRHYGTYPRVLGKYVRDGRVLTLEDAIKKMTWMPAKRCNILDRGHIQRGYWADMVVFDPGIVQDNATIEDPALLPTGISYVIVNGRIAVDNGTLTGLRAGRVLRDTHHRMIN